MSDTLKVACVQLTSTTDISENIQISSELIREAHSQGTQLISLPEVVNLVQRSRRKSAEVVRTEDEETSLRAYRELAAELGVWLHICLLYTSPSPRDRTRSRMPSSA